ncbi:dihydroneopterin aldolase [Falsihalocynthiibacter sp. SS001]|uniref:dihydroneopterin aldolase n=1 Tax=Falsihalocynthiibacter sp. SS001 TaxID=3349698 RepID=UPI0036D29586
MSVTASTDFQHPLRRSIALRPDGIRDRISVRDHIVEVEIGAFEVERSVTQRLSFNVVVEVADVDMPLDDDVDKILSYDRVTDAITQALDHARVNLLETLAQDIAERVLAAPQALRVFVRIEKLDRGAGNLGVEVVRETQGKAEQHSDWIGLAPLIVVATPTLDLAGWLPTFQQHARPVLLLPAAPLEFTKTADQTSNVRLALLAYDAAAWSLAAQNAEIGVVGSRTEMEWGFGQGRVNVWAPMKQVLDSPTPPQSHDAQSLAEWMARGNGEGVVGIGCKVGQEIASNGYAQFLEIA